LPMPWQCLIDTGAQRTHVKEKVVNRLGILAVGGVMTRDFDGNQILAHVYRVHLSFGGPGKDIDVVAGGSPRVPHDVLIGADLLMHCILEWNGPEGTFTIRMP
jgi:predicted aspartyl protease